MSLEKPQKIASLFLCGYQRVWDFIIIVIHEFFVHLGKKSWFFLFLPCLYREWNGKCHGDVQAIMWSEIRTFPKQEKKWGKASYSIWEIVSALSLTNTDKLRYLNSYIWNWIIIICNLSTKLKQKQWHTPGRYTICRSHSWKTIFSIHHNTQLSKFYAQCFLPNDK